MCEESVISLSMAFRKMYIGRFRKKSCRTGTGTYNLGVPFAYITPGIHRMGMRSANFAVLREQYPISGAEKML
jgi:hypothetical protein